MSGLNGDNRWATKAVSKLLNKLIEVAIPRIVNVNQNLFNYAINNIVVPRINKILTMYSAILPSTKLSSGTKRYDSVFLRELDDTTIIKYLKKNPIHYPDEERVLNMLFDEKFFDTKNSVLWRSPNEVYHKSQCIDTLIKLSRKKISCRQFL